MAEGPGYTDPASRQALQAYQVCLLVGGEKTQKGEIGYVRHAADGAVVHWFVDAHDLCDLRAGLLTQDV